MAWGGLNPALTAWRGGINQRFAHRDTRTDGARADKAHGSSSQHQEDADGTVDAFDNDVNYLGSSTPGGNPTERRILEALKRDFEADGRGQLWIHNREIANADIGPWRERDYGGESPHIEHCHWESKQSRERDGRPWKFTHTDALLRELEDADMPDAKELLNADVVPNRSWRADHPANAAKNKVPANPAVRWEFAVTNTWDLAHAAAVDGKAARLAAEATLTAVRGDRDDQAILARIDEVAQQLSRLPDEVTAALTDVDRPDAEVAAALRTVLGDRADEVGRILAGAQG